MAFYMPSILLVRNLFFRFIWNRIPGFLLFCAGNNAFEVWFNTHPFIHRTPPVNRPLEPARAGDMNQFPAWLIELDVRMNKSTMIS